MKIFFIVFLIGHAIAHLVGFVVPWKIVKLEEMKYSTKIFFNKIDVGDNGIRLIGILWLLASLSFIAVSISVFQNVSIWKSLLLFTTIFSLILTIIGLPDSKNWCSCKFYSVFVFIY